MRRLRARVRRRARARRASSRSAAGSPTRGSCGCCWRCAGSSGRRCGTSPLDPGRCETYGDFLTQHGFDDYFVQHYALPVVACVWSSGSGDARDYPAAYLFEFLANHGFLQLGDAPQWYVVEGGSQQLRRRAARAARRRPRRPTR